MKTKTPAAPPPPAPAPVESGDLTIKALKDKKASKRKRRQKGKQGLRQDLNLNIGSASGGSKQSAGLNIPR